MEGNGRVTLAGWAMPTRPGLRRRCQRWGPIAFPCPPRARERAVFAHTQGQLEAAWLGPQREVKSQAS